MKKGFDNDKYLLMQSQHIRERIAQFDNKLYLEFGGKLFDDYHASRVLPGFQPDSKLQMLLQLKDQAEIVIVISAEDIISSKVRGDYGITYDLDVLRLIDAFQGVGLFVGSVCITMYTAAPEVEQFEQRLNGLGIRTFRHYKIPGYPNDVARIVSDEGYGRNEYIDIIISNSLHFCKFHSLLRSTVITDSPLICYCLQHFLFVTVNSCLLFIHNCQHHLCCFEHISPTFHTALL